MTRLRLGTDLLVPDDAVTQTFCLFGKRGSGKSNTAVVLAEEMHKAGAPFVVLDPISAWWGLKSSFDGKGPGLPVYVFGGPHGDLPLQPGAGELMAQVFVRHRQPMVLDMKGWTGADRARFVTAFAEWLLGHNDRVPVHVFLEEADAFIPQRPYKGEERMLGAMDRLVRWGRQEGVGSTTVTQRSAKINKDVTTQTEVLIAHRTTGPQDRDVIRDWIRYHAGDEEQANILSTLPTLPDGTAWVWSPEWLGLLRQVAFRRRETFDSASTPKLGEKRVQPKELVQVDLDRLRDQLADTIEQAKANDPAALKKRIAELERTAAAAPKASPEPEVRIERIEVPVLNGQVDDLRSVVGELRQIGQGMVLAGTGLAGVADSITTAIDRASSAPRTAQQVATPVATARGTAGRLGAPTGEAIPRTRGIEPATTRDPAHQAAVGAPSLGKAERAILAALASYPIPLTRDQLAFLAGYHPRTPGFVNALGALRSAGLVTQGFPSALTAEGRAVAPGDARRPDNVLETWVGRFGKAERAILTILIREYPSVVERQALADESGYHPRTPGFVNALGRLRGLGLVDGLALHSDFARLMGR